MPRQNQSEQKIVDAFAALMQQQEYAAITITDITRRANVSRMAFYRNFTSKEDVVQRFIASVGQQVVEEVEHSTKISTMQDYFAVLFKRIGKYSAVILGLCRANLGEMILSYLNCHLFGTPIRRKTIRFDRYKSRFFAGAFYNVMTEWIITGMKESAENMAKFCSDYIVMA